MHVAITGASSGLGMAVAREMSAHGADVTLVARRRPALEQLAAELRGRSHVAPHDLADPTHAADWIADAERALGPIDVLVSNAGSLTLGPVATFDPAVGEAMMALNLLSPVRLMRAVLPAMLARGSGVVVNVTSVAALVTPPGWIYQSAGKRGSAAFSEALAVEVAGSGVHVMTVYPGMTDTPMTQAGLEVYGESGLVKLVPLGDPAEFARRLRRAIAARRRRMTYPRTYAVLRAFPRTAQLFASLLSPRLPATR